LGKTSRKETYMKIKKEEEIIRLMPDQYNHLVSVGFTREQAINKLKKPKTAVGKLEMMYERDVKRPGVTGISLQGIRRTRDVDKWINQMEKKGLVEDKTYMLKFPYNPLLGRY